MDIGYYNELFLCRLLKICLSLDLNHVSFICPLSSELHSFLQTLLDLLQRAEDYIRDKVDLIFFTQTLPQLVEHIYSSALTAKERERREIPRGTGMAPAPHYCAPSNLLVPSIPPHPGSVTLLHSSYPPPHTRLLLPYHPTTYYPSTVTPPTTPATPTPIPPQHHVKNTHTRTLPLCFYR